MKGSRLRGCSRRGLLISLILLAVIGVAGGSPAAADEPDDARAGQPPAEGQMDCEAVFEGSTPQHWDCQAPTEFMPPRCVLESHDDPHLAGDDWENADELLCSGYQGTAVQYRCEVGHGTGDPPEGIVRCPLENDWMWGDEDLAPPEGSFRIECRNEIELGIHPSGWGPSWLDWLPRPRWADDHREVVVPYEVPDWWIDEVESESADTRAGFEGRGETEEWSDDTKNLGGRGCDLAESPPAPIGMQTCAEINTAKVRLRREIEADDAATGARALLETLENQGGIVPDDCWGEYPTMRYSVTWNPRSHWTAGGWTDRLTSWLAMLLFGLLQQAMLLALWITRVAFEFDIGEYRDMLGQMAVSIDRDMVHIVDHDLSLVTMAWFALVATVGFFALRGKLARAGAELLAALVLAAVFTVLLGPMLSPMPEDPEQAPAFAPDGYLTAFTDVVDQSSRAPLLVANGMSPDQEVDRSRLEELLRSTHGTLHREFIEDPALYLNFGRAEFSQDNPRGEGPGCAEIVDNILTVQNPPRTWPSNYLARYQCVDEASFNSNMSTARLASVALVSLVGLVVATVVGLSGVTLLMSKFLVGLLFVILPAAALSAVLPAAGRKVATWWTGALVQLWLASLAMGSVLMLVLFSIHAMTVSTETVGLSLTERWVGLLIVMFTVAVLRKRMAAASQRVAGQVQAALDRLSRGGEPSGSLWRARSGGSAPAPAPPSGGPAEAGGSDAPVGAGTVAGLGAAHATTGGRVMRSVGGMAIVAPSATKAAMLGTKGSEEKASQAGFDLGGVDRFASSAGYAGLGAAMVGGSLAAGVAGFAGRAVTAPGRWIAGAWQNEYSRRRSHRLNQSYRAQVTETEDLRGQRLADALASPQELARRARYGGARGRFYNPADYGIRTREPSIPYLHSERQVGRLDLEGLRSRPAYRNLRRVKEADAWGVKRYDRKRGQVVTPSGEVRYEVRYRSNPSFLPRLPNRRRTARGDWVKINPSKPLHTPWWGGIVHTVKRDGLPPPVRKRKVPRHLRPRTSYYTTPRWWFGGPKDRRWKDD